MSESKHTADEIMGLIRSTREFCDIVPIESAIRAIIEERDQAVMGNDELRTALTVLQSANGSLIDERDALRAENERLTAENRELREAAANADTSGQ